MAKLVQGDEIWAYRCSWCGRGVKIEDITETLDGSGICPACAQHYNPGMDEPDFQPGYISNIDRE